MGSSPHFTMLSAYEEVLRYIEAVQSDPRLDRKAFYKQSVVDPYWDRFVSGGEFERNLPKERIVQPPRDINELAKNIISIRQSGVESVIVETLQTLSRLLPGPDTTVCIMAADSEDSFVKEYMQGVLGAVVGAGKIAIQVSPCPGWLDRVPATIAHEYHHSVWLHLKWSEIPSFDLLNYLIFEGRACSFSRILFPGPPSPWTEALTSKQEAEQWENIQSHFTENSYEKQIEFIFGGGTVPRFTGYTIGYHIVRSFLERNPRMTVRDWTLMDAQDLLDNSHYEPT